MCSALLFSVEAVTRAVELSTAGSDNIHFPLAEHRLKLELWSSNDSQKRHGEPKWRRVLWITAGCRHTQTSQISTIAALQASWLVDSYWKTGLKRRWKQTNVPHRSRNETSTMCLCTFASAHPREAWFQSAVYVAAMWLLQQPRGGCLYELAGFTSFH